jgi:hypothetical protein
MSIDNWMSSNIQAVPKARPMSKEDDPHIHANLHVTVMPSEPD